MSGQRAEAFNAVRLNTESELQEASMDESEEQFDRRLCRVISLSDLDIYD